MQLLQEISIHCPYCGEPVSVLADGSIAEQQYIEDCEVCCRPMSLSISASPQGEITVLAQHEDHG